MDNQNILDIAESIEIIFKYCHQISIKSIKRIRINLSDKT